MSNYYNLRVKYKSLNRENIYRLLIASILIRLLILENEMRISLYFIYNSCFMSFPLSKYDQRWNYLYFCKKE